ncbi:MAG: HD domain-containing protein [Deltaproteobacteria bacterium]|nr:MAG: HD domain-containing protein [Deltaproteobacteria bacterium]
MNTKDLQLNLWSLLSSLAKTLDLMSPEVADHCMRVAYLSLRLGEELGLSRAELRDLCIAGALHDIGAFSLNERLDLLAFEEKRATQHALAGHLLLKDVPLFSRAAKMVRFHHLPWRKGAGAKENGVPVPRGSHIVHLADRVAVRISRGPAILGQVDGICKSVTKRKGDRFVPRHVEAFLRIAAKDYVWLDIASDTMETSLERSLGHQTIGLDPDMLLSLSRMICRIIDFKSEFTATHSSGVAATGEALARLAGFSPRKRRMFEIAAYLHDLGKLAIPSEILEKPGKLTKKEWHVMRTHVYYTHQILSPIKTFEEIASWGALHQERLNGSGYPFHYTADDLPLGARLMAVADVFTALTEDRPYRKGMGKVAVLRELRNMVSHGDLDGSLVNLLIGQYDEINRLRASAQSEAVGEYEKFRAALS